MRTNHLREWLREHQAKEVAAKAGEEGEMSDPEGREIRTKDRREDRGEGRE